MTKYVLKYWFEWGGTCLWSDNDAAREDSIMFNKKKKFAYEQLCKELGIDFKILYCCDERL